MGLAGIAAAAGIVYIITRLASAETLDFRGERILAWLDPEAYASGKGFQTLQALYAIGSGGIFGKGLGRSMQKLGFVPEEVFLERLSDIAANALLDACTGSNPRQPSQEEMEKLLKCCYYDTEVDF